MPTADLVQEQDYLARLDLHGLPTHSREFLVAPPLRFVPRVGEEQSEVVGGQVNHFASDIAPETRQALQNAVLLAQLAADKLAPDDVDAWYDAYFEVLTHSGLVMELASPMQPYTSVEQADVDRAVLELAAAMLGGPAVPAYRMVVATISALEKLDATSHAVTILRRELHSETARFRLCAVETDDRGPLVSLLAFALDATSESTQVLFFEKKADRAAIRYRSARLRVAEDVLAHLSPVVTEKVAQFLDGYIGSIAL